MNDQRQLLSTEWGNVCRNQPRIINLSLFFFSPSTSALFNVTSHFRRLFCADYLLIWIFIIIPLFFLFFPVVDSMGEFFLLIAKMSSINLRRFFIINDGNKKNYKFLIRTIDWKKKEKEEDKRILIFFIERFMFKKICFTYFIEEVFNKIKILLESPTIYFLLPYPKKKINLIKWLVAKIDVVFSLHASTVMSDAWY